MRIKSKRQRKGKDIQFSNVNWLRDIPPAFIISICPVGCGPPIGCVGVINGIGKFMRVMHPNHISLAQWIPVTLVCVKDVWIDSFGSNECAESFFNHLFQCRRCTMPDLILQTDHNDRWIVAMALHLQQSSSHQLHLPPHMQSAAMIGCGVGNS